MTADVPGETVFREWSAEEPTESIPYAHLSIELGHLYMEDFAHGAERLRSHFAAVAPWVEAARATAAPLGTRPRVSTCFLVDDYFTRFSTPAEVIPELLLAARESGLAIDYLARESGCATSASGDGPAALVEARLVPAPLEGTNGTRPPTHDTGWLCNGVRTPQGFGAEAMAPREGWRPPREIAARRHSVFLDVELWDGEDEQRVWSCPFLAAVWQLLRLGLLRDRGAPVLPPVTWTSPEFPRDWDDLPALIRLDPAAAPFAAYRTFSVLGTRFLPVEHAVRLILDHLAVDPVVGGQAVRRAEAEGLLLPRAATGRIAYTLLAGDRTEAEARPEGGRR